MPFQEVLTDVGAVKSDQSFITSSWSCNLIKPQVDCITHMLCAMLCDCQAEQVCQGFVKGLLRVCYS